MSLPPELWTQIFRIAINDDIHEAPFSDAFEDCVWKKSAFDDSQWILVPPTELVQFTMRQNYRLIKTIALTCHMWRVIASEFLFRTLFIEEPSRLRKLCTVLDRNSSLGWWVKRIQIARYYHTTAISPEELQDTLVSLTRHCPNLEIFALLSRVRGHFAPLADALCTYRPVPGLLRCVSWHVTYEALSKLIWALDSLPGLECVHVEFEPPANAEECISLGSASDVKLELPALRELSVRGSLQDFLEQANGWDMPHLTHLTLNFLTYKNDFPDVVDFLSMHGASLTFLDIDCLTPLDVFQILNHCPLLTTFAFSLDWHLSGPAPTHANITRIGLHGLLHAFGVGTVGDGHTVAAGATRHVNDINFEMLTKQNFPLLRSIRVLNQGLLRALNDANGPPPLGMARWEQWYDQCARQGIGLVDCAGNLLGTLPQEPSSDDEEESDSEEEVVVGEDGNTSYETEEGDFERKEGSPYDLRQLLEECRRMNESREEPMFPPGPLNPNTEFSQFVHVEYT